MSTNIYWRGKKTIQSNGCSSWTKYRCFYHWQSYKEAREKLQRPTMKCVDLFIEDPFVYKYPYSISFKLFFSWYLVSNVYTFILPTLCLAIAEFLNFENFHRVARGKIDRSILLLWKGQLSIQPLPYFDEGFKYHSVLVFPNLSKSGKGDDWSQYYSFLKGPPVHHNFGNTFSTLCWWTYNYIRCFRVSTSYLQMVCLLQAWLLYCASGPISWFCQQPPRNKCFDPRWHCSTSIFFTCCFCVFFPNKFP